MARTRTGNQSDRPPSASRLRRSRAREETRERFIRSAERAFRERDYDSVTVEEIAADAGYSKRSIYLYFGDKRDLFEHALARELARWNDRLRSLERRESNALVLLEEILNDCFDHVAREDGLLRHLLEHWTLSVSTEARRRPPPGGSGSRIEARFDDLLRTFVLCLDRGAIDGTLPLYVDPLAEARWIWSQLVGAVLTPPRNATERSEMVTTWRREASRRIVAALATR